MQDGISVDAAQLNTLLADFLGLIDDPSPILKVAAESAIHAVKRHFEEEGPGWAPLAAATLAGRRGGEGRILRDTGNLMNSIYAGEPSGDSVDVGTEVIYAALQNFGGTVKRETGRQRFRWRTLDFGVTSGYRVREYYQETRSTKVPAREFMYLGDDDVEDVASVIEDYLRLRWAA